MVRKSWHYAVLSLALGAGLLAMAGVALRLTIRDSGPVRLGGLFLGLPLPVCAALFLTGASLSAFRGKRAAALILFSAGVLTGIFWLAASFKWHSGETGPRRAGEVRVGFWNMADHETAFTRGSLLIDEHDLEILGFAEVNDRYLEEDAAKFLENREGWQLVRSGTLALAARGQISAKRTEMLPHDSTCQVYEVVLPENPALTVVLADLGPSPLYRREPILSHILSQMEETPRNTVIMGDFNTPYESAGLDRFRERFWHCFSETGRGFRETWPWPLPALSLDHIWVSRDWRPRVCRKVKSWTSDHAGLWTVIRPAADVD